MIIGAAIGGTLALAFFVLLIYKLVKWMKEKIHQVKSITIRLPKGLEGPETNPLNNYENFKHGLTQNIQHGKIERLSYVIDENDNKNRHGSGSSQYSNSSTDELIFKNGKCTKFGRKPSGDSSGCSSMSSNTTPRIHLSSDSGTESDFIVPPSPDSGVSEQNVLNSHKSPLPILMEVHDPSATEQQPLSQKHLETDSHVDKYNNFIKGMGLKVDQPYSKFGIAGSGSCSVPWRANSLAFYSCNLANSEPSVFEAQHKERQAPEIVAPYSKIGLAKSSGDILGIPSLNKEMGYSKFGSSTPKNSSNIDPSKLTHVAMVMVEPFNKDWPNIRKFLDSKKRNKIDAKKDSPYISVTQAINGVSDEDCGYIKVGMPNHCSKKPSLGYVPFNDVRGMKDPSHPAVPANLIESREANRNKLLDVPEKDQADLSDDIEWNPDNCETVRSDVKPSQGNEDPTKLQLFNLQILQNMTGNSFIDSEPCVGHGICNSKATHLGHLNLPVNSSAMDTVINFCSPSLDSFSQVNCNDSKQFPSLCPQNDLPNCTDSFLMNQNYIPSNDSAPDDMCNSETDDTPHLNEIIISPAALRNGYVPVSALSDSLCDRTDSYLPNITQSNVPLSAFTGGITMEVDNNYVTPSNKTDLKSLKDDVSKTESNSPLIHCNGTDSLKGSKIQNGVSYINGSLKYILKPLPTMESEICEV